MHHPFSTAAALATIFSLTTAQSIPKCGEGSTCPESAPCCSQYGQCGVGAYCLGGCDPAYSFSLQSCMPAAVCKSENYKLTSLDGITPNTQYLGDAGQSNWVSSGTPVVYHDNSILLTMAESTSGTLLMSTHYVWYGKISATMTTSQGQGVVTAFIMMSDVKDEIDFEFVGVDTESAQSNFYWQGVTDYDNEKNLTVSNTFQNSHTYTIDWTPDALTWYIDGTPLRTLNKADTYNSTDNQYHYPQTPARIELSLWPAGLPSNAPGTIAWAGGEIDWNSQYMQNGYYYAMVSDVTVECYQPPPSFSNNFGDTSYYYNSVLGTSDTVCMGNNNTELSSFLASGENPSYNPNAQSSASGTQTSSSASMTATPQTVPGMSGGGNAASDGESPDGSGSGSASSSASSSQPSGGSSSGGFSQGTTGTSQAPGKLAAGSAVALLGFFIAALML